MPASKAPPETSALWIDRAVSEAGEGKKAAAMKSLARAEALEPADDERRRAAALYHQLNEPGRALAACAPTLARTEAPGPWIEASVFAAAMGDRAKALELLAHAERLSQREADRRRVFVRYWELGEHALALAVLESTLGEAQAAAPWMERCQLALAVGDRAKALDSLGRAELLNPMDPERRQLATLYRQLDEPARALAVLEPALKRARAPGPFIERAAIAACVADRVEGLKALARAETLCPRDEERLAMSAFYRRFDEQERALAVLQPALRTSSRLAATWIEHFQVLQGLGERTAAMRALARAVAQNPDDEARRLISSLYRNAGDPARAEATLAPVLGRTRSAGPWLERAQVCANAGDARGAVLALERAMSLQPDDEDRRLVARVYLRLGEAGLALSVLEPVLERARGGGPWIDRAQIFEQRGDLAAAAKALARALATALSDEERRLAAALLVRLGRPAEALELLAPVVQRSRSAGPWIERAQIAAHLGAAGEAAKALSQGLSLRPTDADRRLASALYLRLEKPEMALAVLQPALTRARTSGPWIERGDIAFRLGDAHGAWKALARALALGPSEEERLRLSVLCRQHGDYGRALAALEPALFGRTPAAGAWIERAEIALGLGDAEMARKSLARAAKARPNGKERGFMKELERRLRDPHYWADQAAAAPWRDEKEKRRVLSLLALAEALKPDDVIWRSVAQTYQKLGAFDRALAIFERLSRRRPEQAAARSDQGLCKYLMGRIDDGISDLRRAIELDAAHLPAYLTLGAVFTAQGRDEEAVRLYDQALEHRPEDASAAPQIEALLRARAELADAKPRRGTR